MTRIRMFATDLDGTLLRSDRTISERTAQAMESARLAGIEVLWATARARHSVHTLASSCGFRGKAVCANGAVILDLADGTPKIVDTVSIETSLAATAMEQIRILVPGVVFANVGPTQFFAEPEYAALCDFTDHHRHVHEMVLADTLPLEIEPMVKIVARHPDVSSSDLYRTAAAAGITGVELTHSGAPYMEMAASGVSKASALAQLCAAEGIDPSEVAAAGDAVNDLPMLMWAGTALAPSNALPEILELSDRVLASNDEDGVASYLEELAAGR
ncbi:HAD family hydrolase [Rhodococcus globerulus]|uniref:Cof-type HAD-IIB family hydrolase n=1 Tax=Rhodococcus globerulus TaxID=33008 RepID=A0ABU4BWL8_RHOGO|nr:Cof-type HAD-IIB family hydrolase [Rhodococcus globerulus]MDV6268388.1 Cof-type HAD-IIB family hydrolase [Rhodococcus globerulus]